MKVKLKVTDACSTRQTDCTDWLSPECGNGSQQQQWLPNSNTVMKCNVTVVVVMRNTVMKLPAQEALTHIRSVQLVTVLVVERKITAVRSRNWPRLGQSPDEWRPPPPSSTATATTINLLEDFSNLIHFLAILKSLIHWLLQTVIAYHRRRRADLPIRLRKGSSTTSISN